METRYELETFKVKLMVAEVGAHTGSSSEAAAFLRSIYRDHLDADQEHFTVIFLDNRNRVIGLKNLFTGSQTASIVSPAIVFRVVLLFGAVAIIVGHNHPSGDPHPSCEDIELTARLVTCAEIFGIRFQDHIIVGADSYYSFSDQGQLRLEGEQFQTRRLMGKKLRCIKKTKGGKNENITGKSDQGGRECHRKLRFKRR